MSKIKTRTNADIVNRVTERLSPWYKIEWVHFDDYGSEGGRTVVAYVAGEPLKFVRPSRVRSGILVKSLVERDAWARDYVEVKTTLFAEQIEKLLAGWKRNDKGELLPPGPAVRPQFETIPPFTPFSCTDINRIVPAAPVKLGDKITVKGVTGVVVRHPDDDGLAVISFKKQQPAPLEPLDAAVDAWQIAATACEPEYTIRDGWAYRLATKEDIGKVCVRSDISFMRAIDGWSCPRTQERELIGFDPKQIYPYYLNDGFNWKFAWVKEYPVQECEGRYWRSADEKDLGKTVLVSPYSTPRVEQGFYLPLTGIKRYDQDGARKTLFRCAGSYWSNAWVELKVKK